MVLQKLLESCVGPMTQSEIKETLDLVTSDIKINRIGFKRRTSLRDTVEIALMSLRILKRTEKGPAVLQTLTAQ